jgi:exopolysaccharide production protein ExoQ
MNGAEISERRTAISSALWIPLLWYAEATTKGLGTWINSDASAAVDYLEGNPLQRAFSIVLIVLGLTVLLQRKIQWSTILQQNRWIFWLLFYAAISIFWSDFQYVSFKRWTKIFGHLVMILVVLTDVSAMQSISTLFRKWFSVHLPLSLFLIMFVASIGIGHDSDGIESWVGLTTHKNVLGEVTLTSSLFFFSTIVSNWNTKKVSINVLYLALSLILLIGSKSDDSLLAFGLGVLIFTGITAKRNNIMTIKKVTAFVILAIICFALAFPFRPEVFTRRLAGLVSAGGKDTTLTGRTDLWYDILPYARKHPLLGCGYGSFWVGNLSNDLWEKHHWSPGQAHNGYLDIYVELGAVGIFLLIGIIASAHKNIIKSLQTGFDYGRLRMTFLIVLLIHNIAESSFLRVGHNLTFLFFLMIMAVPQKEITLPAAIPGASKMPLPSHKKYYPRL